MKGLSVYLKIKFAGRCRQALCLASICLLVGCQSNSTCEGDKLKQVTSSAELGDPEAQNQLAQMYEFGECVSRDFESAAQWYQKAAQQDQLNAQKVLGFMYAGGVGVESDSEQALFWFRTAAERGHPEAQLGLAMAYHRGIGLDRSYESAVEWLRRSAQQDFSRGQYNLGYAYESGKGIEMDFVLAYQWYALAARKDYPKAEKALQRLAKNMTPSEITEANQGVTEWTQAYLNSARTE